MTTAPLLRLSLIAAALLTPVYGDQGISKGEIKHLQEKKEHAAEAATTQQHLKSAREAILVQLKCLKHLETAIKKINNEYTAKHEIEIICDASKVYLGAKAAQAEQMTKLDEHSQERIQHMEEEQITDILQRVCEAATKLVKEEKCYQCDEIAGALAPFVQ